MRRVATAVRVFILTSSSCCFTSLCSHPSNSTPLTAKLYRVLGCNSTAIPGTHINTAAVVSLQISLAYQHQWVPVCSAPGIYIPLGPSTLGTHKDSIISVPFMESLAFASTHSFQLLVYPSLRDSRRVLTHFSLSFTVLLGLVRAQSFQLLVLFGLSSPKRLVHASQYILKN